MPAPATNTNNSILTVRQLTKSFGAVEVLHGIDLDIRRGEIHCLLGENGAGKSTLVKVLSGFEQPSGGVLQLFDELGRPQSMANWDNRHAEHLGVVLIHQEFNLAEQLTVAENIFLGSEIRKGLLLDKKLMRARAGEYLQSLKCEIDPDTPVQNLAVSAKQMVEIARTQAKKARLLIMDEPTAVLTQKESTVLFELIERLREQGVAIVYISHKLDEIERLADRITILRDGELVGSYVRGELSKDDMARLMVGRELTTLFPVIPKPDADVADLFKVANLRVTAKTPAIGFSLRRGEILGFAGLVGSGRTAVMEAIVGLRDLDRRWSPVLEVDGEAVKIRSLRDAKNAGIAYLTKDRKGSGLLLNMGLPLNFSLFALDQFASVLIDRKKEQEAFTRAIDTFDIRIKDQSVTAGNLSGGNQQKLLLAKILQARPKIIIIDEPTRGIDIGTRSQIYHFIATLLEQGMGVILISSDITEIIGLSHRVAVMCQGDIAGILEGEEIEEHEIMRYATGLKQKSINSEQLCA